MTPLVTGPCPVSVGLEFACGGFSLNGAGFGRNRDQVEPFWERPLLKALTVTLQPERPDFQGTAIRTGWYG